MFVLMGGALVIGCVAAFGVAMPVFAILTLVAAFGAAALAHSAALPAGAWVAGLGTAGALQVGYVIGIAIRSVLLPFFAGPAAERGGGPPARGPDEGSGTNIKRAMSTTPQTGAP